ncbi:MAG TPA: amino acid permease [Acidobacteria bacterium]|nr:amino acid permease [Acidobacteriota bacterium]
MICAERTVASTSDSVGFRRNIGLFLAVMIGIGAMMGPGIFALPGEVSKLVGPLGILVYLAVGLITVLTALNYSELGAAIPLAGGGYSFPSRTMPRMVSFLTGWFFWIGNTLACAMYGLIFALTIQGYLLPHANVPLIIILTTAVFFVVNLFGMSGALKTITVMNLIELAVLLAFAVLGAFHVRPVNLRPFAPLGFGGFFPAMALIYISYVGFEMITVASEEIVDPGRTIPRSILITVGVATVVYVGVVLVMMGATPRHDLAGSDVPFILVSSRLFGGWGRWAAVVATIMASLSAFVVSLGASARVLYALGRDGHLPQVFSRLHRRFQTPHVALALCAVLVAAFGSSGIVKFVASLSDFGYLMGIGVVNLSVVALHRKMPNLIRPFRPGFYPWLPILGAISCWVFVPALEARSFALGGGLTVLGLAAFLVRRSNRLELLSLPPRARRWAALQIEALRRKKMRVLIIGGETLARNIAAKLTARDELQMMIRSAEHQVTFVDEDAGRCHELQERFSVPVIHGDGTKREILEQAGVDNIDVAIAATQEDGKNVIAAMQAKRLGIAKVVAVVFDPDYVPLLEEEGIIALSAPRATASMVENILDRPGVADLFEISSGVATLVSLTMPENARAAGTAIRDLQLPTECVIAAIIRGKKFVVPRGATVLQPGDEVVIVGPAAAARDARDLLRAGTG